MVSNFKLIGVQHWCYNVSSRHVTAINLTFPKYTMIHFHDLQNIIRTDVEQLKTKQPETVNLLDAVGRIVAEDIHAFLDIPTNSVSAMDGYGLWLEGDMIDAGECFECIGESIAGKPFDASLTSGQCIRIMTGAVVPDSVNTVVMQEHTEREADAIRLTHSVKRSQNIRYCGEEVTKNDRVLCTGHLITASDIPLLASLGEHLITVYSHLRVGVFSVGDELCELGTPLDWGEIYDSNRPTIKALLQPHPVIINDYGIVKDDLTTITKTLEQAAKENDIVVTSGGVSVGDYDFLKDAVSAIGDIVQYKVALKPGKPFVYGKIGDTRYFGLPGNPLSTALSARLFLLPAIYHYVGACPNTLQFNGTLTNAIKRKAGRAELLRGFADYDAQTGQWQVSTNTSQDSHRVYQFSQANVLVFLAAEQTELAIGDSVTLLPIDGKFL